MTESKGNTAVPAHGDVDRVQMLSLRADGTPDQSPGVVMIGDEETARAQTREQFAQQAVSATDQQLRAEQAAAGRTGTDTPAQDVQDPVISELIEAHAEANDAAVKAADSVMDDLFKADDPASKPATSTASSSSTGKASTGK